MWLLSSWSFWFENSDLSMNDADEALPLELARHFFPGCPDVQTIRRWWHKGARGRKLALILRGGRLFCTRKAALDFLTTEPEAAHA